MTVVLHLASQVSVHDSDKKEAPRKCFQMQPNHVFEGAIYK